MTAAKRDRPPGRTTSRSALLAGTVLGLAVAGLSPATASPAAAAPAAAVQLAGMPASTVMLPTGDLARLHTGADGRQTASVLPRDRHGAAGSFRSEVRNGDLFLYPTVVQPYLGRLLDPAMFNVSQLARAGYTTASGRLPVRLTWAGAASQHPVPGITITRSQGGTSDGYLSWASARAFGQALATQMKADAPAHWPIGTGIFAGLTGVRFAGPAATQPVQPHFPMVTLRILATGADGQPAPFAFVTVVNTDDMRKYNGFPVLSNGEARLSLPLGHYSFGVQSIEFVGDSVLFRTVLISDYTLTKAQTLTVDLRTATVQPTVRTPRPGVVSDGDLAWVRGDVLGGTFTSLFQLGGGTESLFAPSAPARFGVSHVSPRFRLDSPADAPQPYTYDLRFDAGSSIPASMDYQVTPAQLTTLNSRYHADGQRVEPIATRFSFLPWLDFGFQSVLPVPVPGERTEYVNGRPDIAWQADYTGFNFVDFSDPDNFVFILADEIVDTNQVYAAGGQLTVDWDAPVVHPGFTVDGSNGTTPFFCEWCRQGDTLGVILTPVIDSEPGHAGFGLDVPGDTPFGPVVSTTRYRLFRDGTSIADEADATGLFVDVPAANAGYRLLFDETRTAPWHSQSTRATTEYTFSSARPAAATAPANWFCGDGTNTDCAPVALLNVNYRARVDLTNRAPAGPQHLALSVTHTQGTPATPITSVTAEVSYDDGATWAPATVTGGNGQFDAAFTAAAPGFVSTRVHATDAAGNTITQTVLRAYTIGAAA